MGYRDFRASCRWFSFLLLFAVLGMGCPRNEAQTSGSQSKPEDRPPLPVLVQDFDRINPLHHDYLLSPPADGLPREELERVFDSKDTQQSRTLWGTQRVLEFSDVNAAHPSLSPVGAWVFGPTQPSGVETVDAVLYAGFQTAPRGSDFQTLLLGLSSDWPDSWELCQPQKISPSAVGTRLVAYSPELGTKIGLLQSGTGEAASWTIDHVAFFSTRLDLELWWAEKGYGVCVSLGSMTSEGEFEPMEE